MDLCIDKVGEKMDWINSWASGIVVSVIIATLIEMLLPESKNKNT